jgi:hypothetical protein
MEESRITRDVVVTDSSYQIGMGMVVVIERGVEENKRQGGNRLIVSNTDEHGGGQSWWS